MRSADPPDPLRTATAPAEPLTSPVRSRLEAALAGRYEIERELGRGGMATVFLARDLKHHRLVALKVLHAELGAALGAERFLREIGVTARLQHPHILPLHDSGEAGGLLYYVMPYVDGESLRARLERERQLPVEDAVRVAADAAGALDYAHRHGVVHRDVKPENILLHDGRALVADFGIARAVQRAAADRETLTVSGVTVGTPAYMSPEQAAGERELDGRSDIFSLGCVLYEMLGGSAPFAAPTMQQAIARVLTEAPRPLATLRRVVPPHVEAAVHRALEKLPADRFPTAAAFAAALADARPVAVAATAPDATGAAVPEHVVRPRQAGAAARLARIAPWGVAAAAVALAAWALARARAAAPAEPVRFALATRGERLGVSSGINIGELVAISPDGRIVAYLARAGGAPRIYLRSLGDLRAAPVAGTEGAYAVEFSPDGRWLLFNGGEGARRIPVGGGTPTVITRTSPVMLAAGDDRVIVTDTSGLLLVPLGSGSPTRIARPDTAHGEVRMIWPRLAPDGETLLYASVPRGGSVGRRLGVMNLATRERRVLDVDAVCPLGVIDGTLLYAQMDGTIMAATFDAKHLSLGKQSPVPVVEGVYVGPGGGVAAAVAPNGTLVYLPANVARQAVFLDRRGMARVALPEARVYAHPRYSPDGKRIAFEISSDVSANIWVYETNSATLTRLTTTGSVRPEWTPDGRRIAFVSQRAVESAVHWQPADGSGPAERLFSWKNSIREAVFSPDGRYVVFREDNAETRRNLLLMPIAGADRTPRPLLVTPFDELSPRVSPDGRWLAYVSDESGKYEVYVRPFPGPGGRWQVSTGDGTEPLWSRDGRQLYYRAGDAVIAAAVRTTPGFEVAGRETLFEGPYDSDFLHPMYDVSPDGKTFLMLRPASGDAQVVVVLNWLTELRAKLAAAERR